RALGEHHDFLRSRALQVFEERAHQNAVAERAESNDEEFHERGLCRSRLTVRAEADETSGSMPTELGERIKQLRLSQDLTFKQVGEKAKVSDTHLSEIERGKTSPTVGALVRIAHALGQEPAQLVDDEELPRVAFTRRSERRTWSAGLLALS